MVDWDAGDVTGRDADLVRDMASTAQAAGAVDIEPHPNSYPITEPLRDPAQLAACLARAGVELLGNWAKRVPVGELDDGEPSDVEVIY